MIVLKKGAVCTVLFLLLYLPAGQAIAPPSRVVSGADPIIVQDFSTPAVHALDGAIRYVFPTENEAVKGIEIQLSAREMMEGNSTQSYARPLYKFDPVEIGLLEQGI